MAGPAVLPSPDTIKAAATPPTDYPYDRATMTRLAQIGLKRDGQTPRIRRVRVARSYDEAVDQRMDYFHPGGEIRDKDGRLIGTHKRGWLRWGYKWEDDPDHLKNADELDEEDD